MRVLKVLAVAAALSPLGFAAQAATVDLSLDSAIGKNVSIHHPQAAASRVKASSFHITGTNGAGAPSGLVGQFVAFCVDIATRLSLPSTYQVGAGNAKTMALQDLFDANYASIDTANANQSAAFQLAVWDTIYQDFSWSDATSTVNTLTAQYLTNAAAYAGDKVWRLTFLDGDRTQDLVTADIAPPAVPLPAAGFLLLGGIGGFGIFARRRRAA